MEQFNRQIIQGKYFVKNGVYDVYKGSQHKGTYIYFSNQNNTRLHSIKLRNIRTYKIKEFKICMIGKNIPNKIHFTAIFLGNVHYNNLRLTNNIDCFCNTTELLNKKINLLI